ncbi:phosphoesterase, partial [Pseudomonas tremae]|nr:phosphoesterase [Pseudomonas tremae]
MSKTVAPPYSRPINKWIYLGIPAAVALILVLLELTSL